MSGLRSIVLTAVFAVLLPGCAEDPDKPFLEFAGGGFIYNYRLATADYGFVVRVVKKLPTDTIIEAELEDPAGGPHRHPPDRPLD